LVHNLSYFYPRNTILKASRLGYLHELLIIWRPFYEVTLELGSVFSYFMFADIFM
jgi:hypothetical protein